MQQPHDIFRAPKGTKLIEERVPIPQGTNPGRAMQQALAGGLPAQEVNPGEQVTAIVRPHHNYGGLPAGYQFQLSREEFEGNRGTLCTPAEWDAMQQTDASPHTQARWNGLRAMRESQIEATRASLTAEQRARMDAGRREYAALDGQPDEHREMVRQALVEKQPPAPPLPQTAAEIQAAIERMEAAHALVLPKLSPRAREAVERIHQEEMAELQQALDKARSAEAQRVAPPTITLRPETSAGLRTARQQLGDIKGLLDEGLIDQQEYAALRQGLLDRIARGEV